MDIDNPEVPTSPPAAPESLAAPLAAQQSPTPEQNTKQLPPDQRSNSIHFAVVAICLGFLCLGVIWRFIDLDYPRTFSFDEHHFVSNARNYIAHKADWNDHPPFGKLVLVPGILIFGDRGLGWRVSSAVFGLAMIVLVGLSAARLFRDRRAGLLAAAFIAVDGFFISYARTALIDNPLTAFMYAALALMLWARSLTWFAAAAVCVGLAVASKWTGVCVLLLAPFLLRRAGKSILHTAWMFAVASLVYLAIGTAALYITKQPISMAGMMRTNWSLLQHHAGFTIWDNHASSKWYTWFFLTHPIVMHHENVGHGLVRASSTIGNLLLWYSTTISIVWVLVGLLRALLRWLRSRLAFTAEQRNEALILFGMTSLMLPFILTHRQSYIFHYLGAYGLGLGLLASRLSRIERYLPIAVLGFLVGAAVVSLLYVPLWTGAVQSVPAYMLRLPFPGWR